MNIEESTNDIIKFKYPQTTVQCTIENGIVLFKATYRRAVKTWIIYDPDKDSVMFTDNIPLCTNDLLFAHELITIYKDVVRDSVRYSEPEPLPMKVMYNMEH